MPRKESLTAWLADSRLIKEFTRLATGFPPEVISRAMEKEKEWEQEQTERISGLSEQISLKSRGDQ